MSDILSLHRCELVRLVNSCGFGDVLSMQQFRYYCGNNDLRGTGGQGVSLLRYAALLTLEWFQPEVRARDYVEHKRIQAQKNAEAVRAAQDIGELPAAADPLRKENALTSFRAFCETYFKEVFYLPWSPDHLRVIEKIERAVRSGGLFAMAMPRGSGKALALDTPIPTPGGWTAMGNIKAGDFVFDEQGKPCRVIFVTEVQYNRECYAVHFSDGEEFVCDAEHLWTVNDRYSRRKSAYTDSETNAAACEIAV